MKWLGFLFALYMLLLSGTYCSGAGDCCNDETGQTTNSNQSSDEKDHNPLTSCSPFFACACQGFVIPDSKYECCNDQPVAVKLLSRYMERSLFDYHSIIWQPPRWT